MTKKFLFFALLMLSLSRMGFAQFTKCKVADIEKLKKGGTVVVAISDDDATNKLYEGIMKSAWTASKYVVIKESELKAYIKANPENYVFNYFLEGGNMGLVLSQNLKKAKVLDLDISKAMILCFFDARLLAKDMKAEFARQVGSMNAVFSFPNLQDSQIGKWKIPTIDTKELMTKELWFTSEETKGEDELKMKTAYEPYKCKIVTKEEIAKAIESKRKDIVYVAQVAYDLNLASDNLAQQYIFLVHNAEDNRVLFFSGGSSFGKVELEKIKNNKQYGQ